MEIDVSKTVSSKKSTQPSVYTDIEAAELSQKLEIGESLNEDIKYEVFSETIPKLPNYTQHKAAYDAYINNHKQNMFGMSNSSWSTMMHDQFIKDGLMKLDENDELVVSPTLSRYSDKQLQKDLVKGMLLSQKYYTTAKDDVTKKVGSYREEIARANPNMFESLVGGVKGYFDNPEIVTTDVVASIFSSRFIGGPSVVGNMAKAFGVEALAVIPSESMIQAKKQEFADYIGEERTWKDVTLDYTTSMGAAGLLRAAGSAGYDLSVLREIKKHHPDANADELFKRFMTSKSQRLNKSLQMHEFALARTVDDINNGRPVDIEELTDLDLPVSEDVQPVNMYDEVNNLPEVQKDTQDLNNIQTTIEQIPESIPQSDIKTGQIEPELQSLLDEFQSDERFAADFEEINQLEQSIKPRETNPNQTAQAQFADNLAAGTIAGVEEDEEGNITFNPEKFVLGLGGYTVAKKAYKSGAFNALPEQVNKWAAKTFGVDLQPKIFVGAEPTDIGAFTDLATKTIMKELDDSTATFSDDAIKSLDEGGKINLGEVITHNELFDQYPELKDMEISLTDGYNSFFDGKEIFISKHSIDFEGNERFKSTLLHELQHSIQKEEFWARGGDSSVPEYMNLWGEQQARATQYRKDMTPEERANETWQQTLERVEGKFNKSVINYKNDLMLNADAPDFVSNLETTISKSQQKSYTKEQLIGYLGKQGIKTDEMQWSGLQGYLDSLPAGAKISKEEILNNINQPILERKVIGGGQINPHTDFYGSARVEDIARTSGNRDDFITNIENDYEAWNDIKDTMGNDFMNEDDWAEQVAQEIFGNQSDIGNTQYGEYTIRNVGDNYREELVLWKAKENRYDVTNNNMTLPGSSYTRQSEAEAMLAKAKEQNPSENFNIKTREIDKNLYKSSHWDEPNVLYHIRKQDVKIEVPNPEYEKAKANTSNNFDDYYELVDKGTYYKVKKGDTELAASYQKDKLKELDMDEDGLKKYLMEKTELGKRSPGADKLRQVSKTKSDKTLLIEEIQSDWHQEGRKKGYARNLTPGEEKQLDDAIQARKNLKIEKDNILNEKLPANYRDDFDNLMNLRDELEEKAEDMEDAFKEEMGIGGIALVRLRRQFRENGKIDDWSSLLDENEDPATAEWVKKKAIELFKAEQEAKNVENQTKEMRKVYQEAEQEASDKINYVQRYDNLSNQIEELHSYGWGTAPAPYSKTWMEKAMKDQIAEAVKNDYDRVAWVGGKANADKYSLSSQIGEVNARMEDGGEGWYIDTYDLQGFSNDSRYVDDADLEETVGAELAKKIREDKGGSYTGLDLEVGGEGMKKFYDKMIPDFVKKYIKKYDSKIEVKKLSNGLEVWSFEVTDKMKKMIKEKGQSLYAVPAAVGIAASQEEENK